jgi:hypothetical protein
MTAAIPAIASTIMVRPTPQPSCTPQRDYEKSEAPSEDHPFRPEAIPPPEGFVVIHFGVPTSKGDRVPSYGSADLKCNLKAVALKPSVRGVRERTQKGPLRDLFAKNLRRRPAQPLRTNGATGATPLTGLAVELSSSVMRKFIPGWFGACSGATSCSVPRRPCRSAPADLPGTRLRAPAVRLPARPPPPRPVRV